MDFMTLMAAQLPENLIGQWLVKLAEQLPSFGVTVIVFTIILRLIMSPLDIWQRVSQRKQTKAMQRLQPKLAKLQKQYANQPQLLRQKQAELQKQEKLHPLASCIPLLVSTIIFFVVFAGFRQLVAYQNEVIMEHVYAEYMAYNADEQGLHAQEAAIDYVKSVALKELQAAAGEGAEVPQEQIDAKFAEIDAQIQAASGAYYDTYTAALKVYSEYVAIEDLTQSKQYYDSLSDTEKGYVTGVAVEFDQNLDEQMVTAYTENMESFLWIKNVFMPDTGSNVVPEVDEYVGSKIQAKLEFAGVTYDDLAGPAQRALNKTSTWDIKRWNGYFVLPILSIVMSFFTTWFMQKLTPQNLTGDAQQQKSQQTTMKILTYMMPLIMGIFAIMYSAAFAIYYFMSNLVSTLLNVVYIVISKILDKREKAKSLVQIK